MKITKDELLKEVKTGEMTFDLKKLADDMGLEFNKYKINICVEGGVDIIVEGDELSTTFYNITMNSDNTILVLQNSEITTVRIELGIDVENADKVLMRYNGCIFSLSDYIKEDMHIIYDTSLFKTGDIVKITTKTNNEQPFLNELKLIDNVGMIEYFTDHHLAYQTLDPDSGLLKHYDFKITDFIYNNIEEFSIEKVNIQ